MHKKRLGMLNRILTSNQEVLVVVMDLYAGSTQYSHSCISFWELFVLDQKTTGLNSAVMRVTVTVGCKLTGVMNSSHSTMSLLRSQELLISV